jgi:hypothetical protein
MTDGVSYNNWAANHNGHFIPTFMPNHSQDEEYRISPIGITKRQNYWLDLPHAGENFTLSMKMEYLTVRRYFDGQEVTSPLAGFQVKSKDVVVQDRTLDTNHIAYTEVAIKDIKQVEELQDFHMVTQARIDVALAALTTLPRYSFQQNGDVYEIVSDPEN